MGTLVSEEWAGNRSLHKEKKQWIKILREKKKRFHRISREDVYKFTGLLPIGDKIIMS